MTTSTWPFQVLSHRNMDVDGRHLSYNYEIEPDCVVSLTIGVYIRHHKMVIHFYSDILMYLLCFLIVYSINNIVMFLYLIYT